MDYLTVYDSGPPSCLTSVWPVPRQPWSCCHDVSPRRDGEGAPEPDQRLGCSRLLPHPAECPSPIEPTAVETEPATHSLPWLLVGCTSPHHRATAWHTGRSPQIGSWMQPSLCLVSFSLSSSIRISLSLIYSPFMLLFFVICSHISLSPFLFSRKCCLPI